MTGLSPFNIGTSSCQIGPRSCRELGTQDHDLFPEITTYDPPPIFFHSHSHSYSYSDPHPSCSSTNSHKHKSATY